MYWHSDTHMIWMVLVWVAIIAAGAIGLRYALGGRGPSGGTTSPDEILKQRYAKGEIDRDEYRQRLEDLRN